MRQFSRRDYTKTTPCEIWACELRMYIALQLRFAMQSVLYHPRYVAAMMYVVALFARNYSITLFVRKQGITRERHRHRLAVKVPPIHTVQVQNAHCSTGCCWEDDETHRYLSPPLPRYSTAYHACMTHSILTSRVRTRRLRQPQSKRRLCIKYIYGWMHL